MGAVQQPQLGELIRRHIPDEQGAVEFPGWPGGGEGVLQDPLPVRFGRHGEFVAYPESGRGGHAVRLARRGHDPVDHRRGETDGLGDPVHDPVPVGPVGRVDELPYHPAEYGAVVRHVVAGHDGDRRAARPCPRRQSGGQRPDCRGERAVRVRREVGGDGCRVQPARGREPLVALLGHGERHHRHLGIDEQRSECLGVRTHGQRVDHRAHDPRAGALRAALGERVQEVLFAQGAYGRRRPRRHGGDAPGLTGPGGRVLGVDRLMGAVEGAEPEMDDTGAELGGVDGGPYLRGEGRRTVQSCAHQSCTDPSRRRATGR